MGVRYINYSTGVIVDGYAYCSCEKYNGLYKLDVRTGKTEFIGFFPGESINKESLYRDSFIWGEKIFFVPENAKQIAYYDMQKKDIEQYRIKATINASNAFLVSDTVWLIPMNSKDDIVLIDLKKNECIKIPSINKHINSTEEYLMAKGVFNKGIIWIVCYNTNIYVSINVNSNEIHSYKCDERIHLFSVFSLHNMVCLSNYTGDVIYSITEDGKTEIVKERRIEKIDNGLARSCAFMIEKGERTYVFPSKIYGKILSFTQLDNNENVEETPQDLIWENDNRFNSFIETKENTFILPYSCNYLICVESNGLTYVKCEYLQCRSDESPLKDYLDCTKSSVYSECMDFGLKEYLNSICLD